MEQDKTGNRFDHRKKLKPMSKADNEILEAFFEKNITPQFRAIRAKIVLARK